MSTPTELKKRAGLGLGSALLVMCCIAGPAVLGAIGGAATGSILLGTGVAALIALSVHVLLRRSRRRADC